jgi:uncharacterized membrane protein YeiH
VDPSSIESINYWVGMAGTVAFAVTAVLAVAPRGIDIFGVLVMGVITAIGGGTLRDVIIDAPVFWGADLMYIWVAVAASLAAFSANSLFTKKEVYTLMLYLDALGVALFGVQATAKVWDLGFGLPLAPVLLGVVTAIGGGLIRDVLAGRQNLLMKRELYAIPVLVGCAAFALVLKYLPEHHFTGEVVCGLGIFLFRAAAIHWNLSVPDWLATKTKEQS